MIKALIGALERIVKNPLLLLPGLVAVGILLGLMQLFAGVTVGLVLKVVFLEMVPEAPLSAFPFQFGALYFLEILGLLVFSIIAAVLFVSLNYWYAAYVRASLDGKASFGEACSETIAAIGKIAAFVVFIVLLMVLLGIALWVFALVMEVVDILGMALVVLLALLLFYLYVKLAFVVQAMALEKGSVKQAFQQSWDAVVKRFWQVLLFLVVLAVINQAIVSVGAYLSDFVLDEILGLIVVGVFWSISAAFSGLALALYYAEKKLGKSI